MTHLTHKVQQIMLQQLSAAFMEIPFNKLLGLKLDHLNEKDVSMSLTMKPELIGNYLQSILHGGVISSVLDMAGGMVVMAHVISKHAGAPIEELAEMIGKSSTIDLQVNFLRPGKGEAFIAKAFLVKGGNKISFARMELFNHEDMLIATATGTYLVA